MGVPGFFMWLLKNYKKEGFVINKTKLSDVYNAKATPLASLKYNYTKFLQSISFSNIGSIFNYIIKNYVQFLLLFLVIFSLEGILFNTNSYIPFFLILILP